MKKIIEIYRHKKILKKSNIDLEYIAQQLRIDTINKTDAISKLLEYKELDPHKGFSCADYLKDNPDVMHSDIHPYIHFLVHGQVEKRNIKLSKKIISIKMSNDLMNNEINISKFNAKIKEAELFFNEDFYNSKYPGVWGWEHYCHYGQYENKSPEQDVIPEILEKYFRSDENSVPLIEMINFSKELTLRKCSKNPDLSIIILNWNKSLMTLQCVYTLLKNSFSQNLEIIIVDNGSRDKEFSQLMPLRAIPCVKIIRNKTNRFYGEANNIGVENSTSSNICLLNNDAFVGVNWDKYLLDELKSSDNIGGVGPKFIFPDGKLQEAGGMLNPCGQNVQVGKGLDSKLSFFNRKADVTHISAACFILSRELYDRINGFDYRYEPAYYEDADLTAKIAALGLKIRYVPDAEVIHVENATSKEPDIGFNFGSLVGANRIKFVEKWGDFLRNGKTPIIPNFLEEYYRNEPLGTNEKIAVVYSPYNLTPGGGERYVLSLAKAARDSGYKTYFCSPERYTKYRLHTVAYELGLDVSNIGLLGEDELDGIDISLFIVMSNELCPSMKAKGKEKNIYHCQFPFPMSDWHKTNCLSNISGFDSVIVNSHFTKTAYEREAERYYVNIPPVYVVSPPVDMIENVGKPDDGIIRILNVGRFIAGGHCKKQIEIVQAFNLLTTELAKKGIESKLTLMGSLSSSEDDRNYLEKIRQLAGDNVEIIVNGSRQDIIEKYQEANFYWHGTGINEDVIEKPQVFEHFGITPVEAMSAGCIPVVWHEGGPSEIIKCLDIDENMHCASSINDYAIKTLPLIGKDFIVSTQCFSEDNFLCLLKVHINNAN